MVSLEALVSILGDTVSILGDTVSTLGETVYILGDRQTDRRTDRQQTGSNFNVQIDRFGIKVDTTVLKLTKCLKLLIFQYP